MTNLTITARNVSSLNQIRTAALVVLVPDRKTMTAPIKALDKLLNNSLSRTMANGDFAANVGAHCWLPGTVAIQRVLLIGAGNSEQRTIATDKKLAETLAKALVTSTAKDAVVWANGMTQKSKAAEASPSTRARSSATHARTRVRDDRPTVARRVARDGVQRARRRRVGDQNLSRARRKEARVRPRARLQRARGDGERGT